MRLITPAAPDSTPRLDIRDVPLKALPQSAFGAGNDHIQHGNTLRRCRCWRPGRRCLAQAPALARHPGHRRQLGPDTHTLRPRRACHHHPRLLRAGWRDLRTLHSVVLHALPGPHADCLADHGPGCSRCRPSRRRTSGHCARWPPRCSNGTPAGAGRFGRRDPRLCRRRRHGAALGESSRRIRGSAERRLPARPAARRSARAIRTWPTIQNQTITLRHQRATTCSRTLATAPSPTLPFRRSPTRDTAPPSAQPRSTRIPRGGPGGPVHDAPSRSASASAVAECRPSSGPSPPGLAGPAAQRAPVVQLRP